MVNLAEFCRLRDTKRFDTRERKHVTDTFVHGDTGSGVCDERVDGRYIAVVTEFRYHPRFFSQTTRVYSL